MTKILVLDRGDGLAEQLRGLSDQFADSPKITSCTRIGAVGEMLEEEGPFDILVAGPSLGTRSGLARLRIIAEELPEMRLVLAFSRRPDASLRDIVRTGAIDLLQLPVEDAELVESVERAVALVRTAPGGRATRGRGAGSRPRGGGSRSRPARHRLHHRLGHRRLRQDVLRHQPGLVPPQVDGQAGLHRRPRPAVRRGLHRAAPAPEVHDLRRPPARGRQRIRPPGPHRGVHGRPRHRRPRPLRPPGAERGRPDHAAGRHPHPRGGPQPVRLRPGRHARPPWPRRSWPPSTCPTCST